MYANALRSFFRPLTRSILPVVLLVVHPVTARAATRYVNVNNPSPASPYTNWPSAATNIQDAVDAAVAGEDILVTNGIYQTGARAVYGMSNRVAVTKPVTVRSVNGSEVTTIAGYRVPGTTNGPTAVRCVYLTNGAVLSGFTLTNGATQISVDYKGGGIRGESTNAVATNCVLAGNSAYLGGGGYGCTLNDCSLTGNSASYGGGAYSGALNDCTVTGNSASQGGGAYSATLNNCTITGNSASQGGGAQSGTLNNCTLERNSASSGGGAYSATLNNCTVTGNSASYGGGAQSGTLNNYTLERNSASYGGGAGSCTVNNCALTGNSAFSCGGGASFGTLNNCTLTGNSAGSYGGGANSGTLTNCILYYNSAPRDGNYFSGTLNYCCTTPLPFDGVGNIDAEPQLASASHLSAASPCRGQGSAGYATGLDIDGDHWASPPSIGCDESCSGSVTDALSVGILAFYTNVAVGFAVDFQAAIAGRVNASRWDFGDGAVLSNRPWTSHAWATPGDYVVELRAYSESYPSGLAATVTMHVVEQPVHYVALDSANAVPPYSSWATAATNIQDAVDAATLPGALVLVTNGLYKTGARAVYGMRNRVAVTKPLTLRSVNGLAMTAIVGSAPNGSNATRCVYVTNGAVLAGFTLTNGATQTYGDLHTSQSGGGVWCESVGALVTNCVVRGNSAYNAGGGAYSGTLNNCALERNSASSYGGGADSGILNNCSLTFNSAYEAGGGASSGTLNHCTIEGNSAYWGGAGASSATLNTCTVAGNSVTDSGGGGGAESCTVNNCTLWGNSAPYGGGAYLGTLNNCTLSGNSATYGAGTESATLNNCTLTGNSASVDGGGAYSATLNNCIVYYNTGPIGSNYDSSALSYCCATPLAAGLCNFTNAPLFVNTNAWNNLRLQANSPCINAGANASAPGLTDLDSNPRIVRGTVDVGAYEFQGPGSSISYAWLQKYGLPTDGSADYTDADHDGLNNWQEWICGTDPTNASSALRLLAPAAVGSNVNVSWQSVAGLRYFLEFSTNLGASPPFQPLITNLVGQPGTTVFRDPNGVGLPSRYYRVGVGN